MIYIILFKKIRIRFRFQKAKQTVCIFLEHNVGHHSCHSMHSYLNSSPPSVAYASELGRIGSDDSLSPVRRQAITWTNAGLLSIGLMGTHFSEILIGIL